MKKALLVLALAMVVAGGVCAQALFGEGATLKDGFITIGGGVSGVVPLSRYQLDIGGTTYAGDWKAGFGGGANVFADFKYAALDVDFQWIGETTGVDLGWLGDYENKYFSTNLLISLKGKYPMETTFGGTTGVMYPYAGADYRIGLAGTANDNDIDSGDVGDTFNALSIIIGVGYDMPLNSNGLLFRVELGVGYTLPTEVDKDTAGGFDVYKLKFPFKIAVGYTF